MRVIKRDGSIQPFDLKRLQLVLRVLCGNDLQIAPLIDRVVRQLTDELVHVDKISNAVEVALMESGYLEQARSFIRYRAQRTTVRQARALPDKNAIGDYIFASKYARWNAAAGRRETWTEAVHRVMRMHYKKYGGMIDGETFDRIQDAIIAKKILPSMRSLQFGGAAVEKHNARMYNCSFTHIDRVSVFSEIMYLLLCGCGVGYSVQWRHVNRLGKLAATKREVIHHTIGDSIEGWVEAVNVLFQTAYAEGGGQYVEFNYGLIRPEGAPLRTSGGVAPGHLALKHCLDTCRDRLRAAAGRRLRPIELHDIICTLAECVLSGGIRRSSLIALFSPDDGEMMYSKVAGNFDPASGLNAQRMMANNSVVILRSRRDAKALLEKVLEISSEGMGEPGFFLTEDEDNGTNPCGEIGLTPLPGGFAFCNLTEINVAACENEEDFYKSCELAAILGTMQAGYTDFGIMLGTASRKGCERDALLGVSLTGVMDNWELIGDSDGSVLERGAAIVLETNDKYAKLIGINSAVRLTTVKPSGTASLVLGAVGSGIHEHHARRYFRRVTANPNEAPAQLFRSVNPHMVEVKPNGDWALTFPIQVRDDAITLKNSTAEDFLNKVLHVYEHWVVPGTRVNMWGCTHNVSCTVTVREGEDEGVRQWLLHNIDNITAMSFVPMILDKLYPYAPRESVSTASDEVRWNALIAGYKPVDYTKLNESGDKTTPMMEPACVGGVCEVR